MISKDIVDILKDVFNQPQLDLIIMPKNAALINNNR